MTLNLSVQPSSTVAALRLLLAAGCSHSVPTLKYALPSAFPFLIAAAKKHNQAGASLSLTALAPACRKTSRSLLLPATPQSPLAQRKLQVVF